MFYSFLPSIFVLLIVNKLFRESRAMIKFYISIIFISLTVLSVHSMEEENNNKKNPHALGKSRSVRDRKVTIVDLQKPGCKERKRFFGKKKGKLAISPPSSFQRRISIDMSASTTSNTHTPLAHSLVHKKQEGSRVMEDLDDDKGLANALRAKQLHGFLALVSKLAHHTPSLDESGAVDPDLHNSKIELVQLANYLRIEYCKVTGEKKLGIPYSLFTQACDLFSKHYSSSPQENVPRRKGKEKEVEDESGSDISPRQASDPSFKIEELCVQIDEQLELLSEEEKKQKEFEGFKANYLIFLETFKNHQLKLDTSFSTYCQHLKEAMDGEKVSKSLKKQLDKSIEKYNCLISNIPNKTKKEHKKFILHLSTLNIQASHELRDQKESLERQQSELSALEPRTVERIEDTYTTMLAVPDETKDLVNKFQTWLMGVIQQKIKQMIAASTAKETNALISELGELLLTLLEKKDPKEWNIKIDPQLLHTYKKAINAISFRQFLREIIEKVMKEQADIIKIKEGLEKALQTLKVKLEEIDRESDQLKGAEKKTPVQTKSLYIRKLLEKIINEYIAAHASVCQRGLSFLKAYNLRPQQFLLVEAFRAKEEAETMQRQRLSNPHIPYPQYPLGCTEFETLCRTLREIEQQQKENRKKQPKEHEPYEN